MFTPGFYIATFLYVSPLATCQGEMDHQSLVERPHPFFPPLPPSSRPFNLRFLAQHILNEVMPTPTSHLISASNAFFLPQFTILKPDSKQRQHSWSGAPEVRVSDLRKSQVSSHEICLHHSPSCVLYTSTSVYVDNKKDSTPTLSMVSLESYHLLKERHEGTC